MNAPASTPGPAADAPAADPSQATGFVLAGDPPVLDAAVAESQPRPAPAPAPAPPPATAAAPVHEPAPDLSAMDHVARVALDSADLANRGAQAAAGAASDLRQAQETLLHMQAAGRKQSLIALGVTCTVMLVCMAFFLIVGIRINSRINQLDHTLGVVVKRAAEMNTGVESMEAVRTSVTALAAEVEKLAQTSAAVSTRLEETVKQTESLTTQIPSKTAQQVASSAQNMSRQVEAMGARLQSQATAVQALSREVQTLRASVGNVDRLNRDVQALITLQRERYLEALQKAPAAPPPNASNAPGAATAAAPAAPAERLPQYPRYQAPTGTSPNAQPAPRTLP